MGTILQKSSLARVIAHTFHCISTINLSHVIINSSIDLSLQVPRCETHEALGFGLSLDEGSHPAKYPTLRPYHALLLLFHAEEVLKSLPLDPSPLLYELIENLTPTQR
jgi:nitrogen permease regulator 3-like protein